MLQDVAASVSLQDLLLSLALLALFVLGAVVAAFVGRIVLRHLEERTPNALPAALVRAARGPAVLFVAVQGIFVGLAVLPELEVWRGGLMRAWAITVVLIGTYTAARSVTSGVAWYGAVVAPRTPSGFDETALPIVRRALLILVYGIAVLILLQTMSISISPILGGLGIAGLAVALAVQPTLSNFFAGAYVVSDRAMRVGDYIELQGGPSGYVVEIGWRSTKVRNRFNNLVVIPNSTLADTIVTNYQLPNPPMYVLVTGGVSYSSDLNLVERVCVEVANQAIESTPEAVKESTPWFGFDSFGESNITFWIFLQARDRLGTFVVANEYIKRLHIRLREEGIEINYPVRKIVYGDGSRPASV